mgnify:CR=1 FL=1
MEQPQVHIEPTATNGVSDSAEQLGASLAKQQLGITQDAYQARYSQGISSLWESQIYVSQVTGEELAALRLEGQRQFAISVLKTVLMMGVPCGAIAWWTFGAAVGVIFFVGSFFLGCYFGSR